MVDTATQGLSMGKQQKTLILNDELCELVQRFADKKGTNFQRVVQAALLEFFCRMPDCPDERWIGAAVSLEKGKVPLFRVPLHVCEQYVAEVERKIALRKARGFDRNKWTKWAEQQIEAARSDLAVWTGHVSLYGGGLEGFIAMAISDLDDRDLKEYATPPSEPEDE